VKVRVIGDCSLGWVEVAEGWGARIDAVVFGAKPCQVLRRRFSHLTRIDFTSAMNLCVRKPWDGIVFATVKDAEAADAVRKLVERWRPLITVLAVPSCVPRSRWRPWVQGLGHAQRWTVRHQDLGGVTEAQWILVHLTRDKTLQALGRSSLMTASHYHRPLQTALDDTEPGGVTAALECRGSGEGNVVGFVTVGPKNGRREMPVYDSAGRTPDVSQLPAKDRCVWVLTETVWRKERVVRQILPHELLSLWDYEGKLESRRWDQRTTSLVVESRLRSPPAKILRAVAYPAFDYLLKNHVSQLSTRLMKVAEVVGVGRTMAVPRSPLEKKAETGRAAATVDGASVDLAVWAPPGETMEEAVARERLRKLAVTWWAFNVERDGVQWLEDHPAHTEQDVAAIEDCIRRAKACSY
jgi:hypothetical protein